MSIKIYYFAAVREGVGIGHEVFEPQAPVADVRGLREQLIARGGAWAATLGFGKAVRASVNQDIARDHTPVKAGDEIAFFPPVTGG